MRDLSRERPMGIIAFMATVVMLFTAFTASYLVRRTSADWRPVPLPLIVWANTALLLASSVTMERARCSRRPQDWLRVTIFLGVAFLAGQVLAWLRLQETGVSFTVSPHASFLAVLASLHGLHVVGGLVALLLAVGGRAHLGPCAAYWHLMGGIWLWLLILLSTI